MDEEPRRRRACVISLIQSDQVQVFERLKSPQRQSGASAGEKHKYFVTGADDIGTAELAVYLETRTSLSR